MDSFKPKQDEPEPKRLTDVELALMRLDIENKHTKDNSNKLFGELRRLTEKNYSAILDVKSQIHSELRASIEKDTGIKLQMERDLKKHLEDYYVDKIGLETKLNKFLIKIVISLISAVIVLSGVLYAILQEAIK